MVMEETGGEQSETSRPVVYIVPESSATSNQIRCASSFGCILMPSWAVPQQLGPSDGSNTGHAGQEHNSGLLEGARRCPSEPDGGNMTRPVADLEISPALSCAKEPHACDGRRYDGDTIETPSGTTLRPRRFLLDERNPMYANLGAGTQPVVGAGAAFLFDKRNVEKFFDKECVSGPSQLSVSTSVSNSQHAGLAGSLRAELDQSCVNGDCHKLVRKPPPIATEANEDYHEKPSNRSILSPEEEYRFLERQCILTAKNYGGTLHHKMISEWGLATNTSISILLRGPMPFRAALAKWWVCLLMMLGSAVCLVWHCAAAANAASWNHGLSQHSKFRFTAIRLRGGGTSPIAGSSCVQGYNCGGVLSKDNPISWPGIQSFGLLLDGCVVPSHDTLQTVSGPSMTLTLPTPTVMNGWYIMTPNSTDARFDAVRFVLHGELPDGTWTVVGSSGWSKSSFGDTVFFQNSYRYATTRNARIDMIHTTAWPWYISNAAGMLFSILLMASAIVSQNETYRFLLPAAFGLHAVLLGISAALLNSVGFHRQSFSVWQYAVGQCAFFIIFLTESQYFIPFCMLCGTFYIVCYCIEVTAVYHSGLSPLQLACGLPYLGILQVVASLGLMLNERRLWKGILRENRKVIEVHNEAWRQLTTSTEQLDALVELRKACRRVQRSVVHPKVYQTIPIKQPQLNPVGMPITPASLVRQGSYDSIDSLIPEALNSRSKTRNPYGSTRMTRRTHSGDNESLASFDGISLTDLTPSMGRTLTPTNSEQHVILTRLGADAKFRPKARSLDQLYAQAAGVHEILIGKIVEWAHACNGSFPVTSESTGSFDASGLRLNDTSQFAKIKSVERAIEKAQLIYKGDISRLLDIVRQRIIVQSISDMTTCVQVIEADPEVRIVRIKNRMDPEYDSYMSAGFRYVHLNLCVSTEQTRKLCIDSHVCEVQIVYRDFFVLQNSRREHRRFLDFRSSIVFLNLKSRSGGIFGRRILGGGGESVSEENFDEKEALEPVGIRRVDSDAPPDESFVVEASTFPPSLFDVLRGKGQLSQLFGRKNSALSEVSTTRRRLRIGIKLPDAINVDPAQSAREQWLHVFTQVYLNSTTQEGGYLDKKLETMHDAMARATGSSVFNVSTQLAAALSKRWFQLCLFAVMVAVMSIVATHSRMLQTTGKITAYHWNYTALELRDPYGPQNYHGILSFGLLLDGCKVPSQDATWVVSGPNAYLTFPQPREANGWYLITQKFANTQYDAVRFRVYADDNEDGWRQVGSSETYFYQDKWTFVDGRLDTPVKREHFVAFDQRAPLAALLRTYVGSIGLVIGLAATLACGLLHKEFYGKWMMAVTGMLEGLSCLMGAVCFVASGKSRESVGYWLIGIYWMGAVPTFVRRESSFIRLLLIGVHIYFLSFIIPVIFAGKASLTTFKTLTPYVLFILYIVGVSIVIAVFRTRSAAQKIILPDKAVYDSMWNSLLQVTEQHKAALNLKAFCDQFSFPDVVKQRDDVRLIAEASRKKGPLGDMHLFRHTPVLGPCIERGTISRLQSRENLPVTSPFRHLSTSVGAPNPNSIRAKCLSVFRSIFRRNAANSHKIKSLDRLYVQAVSLDMILREKIKQWGSASRGMLPVTEASGNDVTFVECSELINDPAKASRIKWAKLKSSERAIEKVLRSYSGDVSRLIDVCRQTLVFETIEELTACLEVIIYDEEVVLQKVKNRMDPTFQSLQSAGYRDVRINLRIRTSETERLNVSNHVCEVLLLLKMFALVKNDEGHARYVAFRNALGE